MGIDTRKLGTCLQSDECYTPVGAIKHIFQFLDPNRTYYECTSGVSSNILDAFDGSGYKIVGSEGKDFFECTSGDVYGGCISNPPYSKKDQFIKHAYELNKPWAFLLPIAALQGQTRGKLFIDKGVHAVVYNKRVDFTGKKSPTFGNVWLMWNPENDMGFNVPTGNNLVFIDN